MKEDFRAAFDAGKQAVEDLPRWRLTLFVIAAIILGNVLRDWLVAHYSLSRLKSFLLSLAVMVLAGVLFGLVERAIRRKRNQSNG